MTRGDAQRLLDALEPGHLLRVQVLRRRSTGEVTSVVVTWCGAAEVRDTEADALARLVARVYALRGRPAPATAPQPALPGVR